MAIKNALILILIFLIYSFKREDLSNRFFWANYKENKIYLNKSDVFKTKNAIKRKPASTLDRCNGSKGNFHYNKTKLGKMRGGFIANTAFVGENVYLGKTVDVCDNANVSGNTRITGDVIIGDNATITGNVIIKGKVVIDGESTITGNVRINGKGIYITGQSVIKDNAQIMGHAKISGDALIKDEALVQGNSKISGNSLIGGKARIEENFEIKAGIYDSPVISSYEVTNNLKTILEKKEKTETEKSKNTEDLQEVEKYISTNDLQGISNKLIRLFDESGLSSFKNYRTPANYLIDPYQTTFKNDGCKEFPKCNPIKFSIRPNSNNMCSIVFETEIRDSVGTYIVRKDIDFSIDISSIIKSGAKGWDNLLKDSEASSISLVFKNPIVFDTKEVTKGLTTIGYFEIPAFYFPLSKTEVNKADMILETLKSLKIICEKTAEEKLKKLEAEEIEKKRNLEEEIKTAEVEKEINNAKDLALWKKGIAAFKQYLLDNNYEEIFANLGWVINYSGKNDRSPFFAQYDTSDVYLINEGKYFKKNGCDQFNKCNIINIEISSAEECKIKLIFTSYDKDQTSYQVVGTVDFSKDIKFIKAGKNLGWNLNTKGADSKSISLFFNEILLFELLIKTTTLPHKYFDLKLESFHFPTIHLNPLHAELIFQGLNTVHAYCKKNQ